MRSGPMGVAVLAGIIPLKSAKMASVAQREGAGNSRARCADPGNGSRPAGPEAELEKGIEIAARLVAEVSQVCQGVHVMAIGAEALYSADPAQERHPRGLGHRAMWQAFWFG